MRGLLDTGSEASFITEQCAQLLRLRRQPFNTQICGISGLNAGQTRGKVSVVIHSHQADFEYPLECFVMRKLSDCLPKQHLDVSSWKFIKHLPLADPAFNQPAPIDLLLGADVFANCLASGVITNNYPYPTALNTQFGWVIMGQVDNSSKSPTTVMNVSVPTERCDVESLLQRFWEIEEVATDAKRSPIDIQCVDQYCATTYRAASGKYVVKLPFINFPPILGHSRHQAVRVLLQMERRFERQPDLKHSYAAFMKEYIDMGHMESVPSHLQFQPCYYFPHHAVMKANSTTTKLRVVFNASARSSNNRSLNDKMHIGPPLQADISDVLLRFRQHKIAFSADIAKMYRQILVCNDHLPYQRIVWRDSPQEEIRDYTLLTVTYGTNAAPFLAIQTLRQLAEDEGQMYLLGKEAVLNDMYVDDAITGAPSIDRALKLQDELRRILSAGGFELRKFASNAPELLAHLPDALCEATPFSSVGHDDTDTWYSLVLPFR